MTTDRLFTEHDDLDAAIDRAKHAYRRVDDLAQRIVDTLLGLRDAIRDAEEASEKLSRAVSLDNEEAERAADALRNELADRINADRARLGGG
jgi:adenosine/AMP kinase